jgi:dUTP pyrophosphatase
MKLKVKKLNSEAVLPKYATDGSNALDLVATGIIVNPGITDPKSGRVLKANYIEVRTSIAVEIPKGYVGLLFPRSSITNTNQILGNAVGVIDSDYRGEIVLRFKILEEQSAGAFKYANTYQQGDKVGQLLLVQVPTLEVEEVEELGNTERGLGGFGSTDVKKDLKKQN